MNKKYFLAIICPDLSRLAHPLQGSPFRNALSHPFIVQLYCLSGDETRAEVFTVIPYCPASMDSDLLNPISPAFVAP